MTRRPPWGEQPTEPPDPSAPAGRRAQVPELQPGLPAVDRPGPPRQPGWRQDAPSEPFPVPWGWTDGLVLVGWSLLAQGVVYIPFGAAGIDIFKGLQTFVYLLTTQLVTLAGAVAWLQLRGALTWRLLGPLRPTWRHVWMGLGVGASGYLIVIALLALASLVFGPLKPPQQPVLERSTEGGLATLLGFTTAVGLAPLVEEFVFRSVLFQALRQRTALWPAVWISAIAFGVVHLQAPLYAVALAILGVWLALALHRTGSLVVPIVGHGLFNAIALSLALIVY